MRTTRFHSDLLLLCLLALALFATGVQAQSGRRQTKPPPAAPIPTPTPEPTPEPKAKTAQSDIGFLLASDRGFNFDSLSLSFYDPVMRGCGDRLRSGSSAHVEVTEKEMNRSDAIKRAKAETTTYVVLLKLKSDNMRSSSDPYSDLELDFVVFAPGTGKMVTQGTAYQNTNRAGPVVVGPTGRNSGNAIYREQLLQRQGEEVGERILKALHLNVSVPDRATTF
jgi:hypothetical protein